MHTGQQLTEALFQVRIDGNVASRAELLPDWNSLDRFGIVVYHPFGGIGASYLIQLAITAYYDCVPTRRQLENRLYPEVFVFHVGGRWGDHGQFDIFPPRKEVFVPNEPARILEALNDRGITRLAVPDRDVQPVQHAWKEPPAALERLMSTWAYSPSGRVASADVSISSSKRVAEANAKITLHADASYQERLKVSESLTGVTTVGNLLLPDTEYVPQPLDRSAEVSQEARDRIRDARQDLDEAHGRTESYRRIPASASLCMLHYGPAPVARQTSVPDFEGLR